MSDNLFHVTCSTDDKYARHCGAMLCSLLDNNKQYSFHIHILIDELSDQNMKDLLAVCNKFHSLLSFHKVNKTVLQGVKFRNKNPLSYAAYYRVLLPTILDASIHKVLYLDCDIIVVSDISRLFLIEIDDYALAAVRDFSPGSDLHRTQLSLPYKEKYFCSGVMMINLDFWRDFNAQEKLIEYSKRERFVFLHDQDSLNYVFKGRWYELPPKWNRWNKAIINPSIFEKEFDKYEYYKSPVIIHYGAKNSKPWYNLPFTPYKSLYWKYIRMTPWKNSKPVKYKVGLKYYIDSLIQIFLNFTYKLPYLLQLCIFFVIDLLILIYSLIKGKTFICNKYLR